MNKSTSNTPTLEALMTDGLRIALEKIDRNHKVINKHIHRHGLRVANTDMSYRQINYLDNSGLLGSSRKSDDKKWRLFKLRDIVYLKLVFELKKFGVTNQKLKGLCEFFYNNEKEADLVILACLSGVEMTLMFGSNGKGLIFAPNLLYLHDEEGLFRTTDSFAVIRIILNEAVNDTLIEGGAKQINIKVSSSEFEGSDILRQTEPEKKIIQALRNNSFQEIRIKKKDSKPYVLYATEEKQSDITQANLLSTISKHDFVDVKIIKRDGKVVHYKQEKAIKL